jgi:hypothetical protein
LQPFQGFAAAEGGQVSALDKIDDEIGVGFGIFAQGPANRFLDEELARLPVLFDDGQQQAGVRLRFVTQLEQDGAAVS